jgi:fatty acid desaturase
VVGYPACHLQERRSATDRIALRFIHDGRDLPFLKLMVILTATVIPSGVVLFVPGAFRWWLGAAHLALVLYFLGPFVLMLHNTSHRTLFRRPWQWMNHYIPWVLGPFFGESPGTYFAHHVGMHHPENNLEDDLSSTLPYVRDSFAEFLRYFLRFFFCVIFEMTRYFRRKRRRALLLHALTGEVLFAAAVAGLMLVNARATLVAFVVPLVLTRFLMMTGNWGQHAFVDRAAPENCYRNSITCINTGYNTRCFNDGYHIGHHLKPTRHWTEMPQDFWRHRQTYQAEGAIVFSGIDFFGGLAPADVQALRPARHARRATRRRPACDRGHRRAPA